MRIYTDANGLGVNAITRLADGTPVEGQHYNVLHGGTTSVVEFQRGNPAAGMNGTTNEAQLHILIHRTQVLQQAQPCPENEEALYYLRSALSAFERRATRKQLEATQQALRPE